jgi:hypothetical protein
VVPTTVEATVVLLLAIAPGYIAISTWARAKTWLGFGSDLDTILRSLAVSLLIQVPMFPLTIVLGLYPSITHLSGRHAGAVFLWLLLTVLIVPIGGGALASWIYNTYLLPLAKNPNLSVNQRFWAPKPPTPWDRFFFQEVINGTWLVLKLDDGTYVAGTWEEGSSASTTPNPHGLYLKREWQVSADGELQPEPTPFTGGLLIEDASRIREIRIVVA